VRQALVGFEETGEEFCGPTDERSAERLHQLSGLK
jgi:hypothetical protein